MAAPEQEGSYLQTIGFLIFIGSCGFTAMQEAGFGFGNWQLSPETCFLVALVGGAIGGMLLDIRRWWAALIGGAVAGPCGLGVLLWYLSGRQQVWTLELVLVQGIASLPGVGVYWLLRKLGPQLPEEEEASPVAVEGDVPAPMERRVNVLPPTALKFDEKEPEKGK